HPAPPTCTIEQRGAPAWASHPSRRIEGGRADPMSIPVLIQAYDEVRRLAIAGSVVAPGDFRLKKLVPPLEQAGQKAPVFAKVAEAVKRLVESHEQTSAAALLEL